MLCYCELYAIYTLEIELYRIALTSALQKWQWKFTDTEKIYDARAEERKVCVRETRVFAFVFLWCGVCVCGTFGTVYVRPSNDDDDDDDVRYRSWKMSSQNNNNKQTT